MRVARKTSLAFTLFFSFLVYAVISPLGGGPEGKSVSRRADHLFSGHVLAASYQPDVKESDQSESLPADSRESQAHSDETNGPPMEKVESQISLRPAVMLSHFVLPPPGDELTNVTIQARNSPGEGVIVSYCGLGGNLPGTYGNTVALWGSSIPNLGGKPLAIVQLKSDEQPNEILIPYQLGNTNYCVTYQVGNDLTTMCALAQLQPGCTNPTIPKYIEIKVDQITTNSLRVYYSTLPGYLPNKYQNWIGLWQGYATPYNGAAPLGKAVVDKDFTEGYVTINNVSLASKLTYTLIYFTGPATTTAASLLYFQTGPPQL